MSTGVSDLIKARSAIDPFGRPKAEDIAKYERAKAALNKEAMDNWESETWHREQAAILSERFDYGFQFDNLFPTYLEVRNVGEFDTVTISERRGLNVFWTARGGYIDETQLKTERFDVPRDTIGFHVSEFEDKLRANYAETLEQLADLAQQRLDAEVNRRMFNLLQFAIPSSSPYYVNAATGLTKEDLDTALREVNDQVLREMDELVGEGVTSVRPDDHVLTLFSPQCRECAHCRDERTNLCLAIREQQNKGFLPDGTTRLSRDGEAIRHFMGTSTFAEYAVLPEIALAKIAPEAPSAEACVFACGLSTGIGAALNTAKVQPGATCVVFGTGLVGLGAVAGCRLASAERIIAVDLSPERLELARGQGATEVLTAGPATCRW